jgi:hypothetical protein
MQTQLAGQFNIKNIVSKVFDGSPESWVEFSLLWRKADEQMTLMHFAPSAKFWELKKCVSKSALDYINGLPADIDASYEYAWRTFNTLYNTDHNLLKNLVRQIILLPLSNGTHLSRQKVHSSIISYKQGCNSIGASDSDVLMAIEMVLIEGKLDEQWKKDWFRYCATKKNAQNTLGYDVNFNDLATRLHNTMVEQMRLIASGESKHADRSSRPRKEAALAAQPAQHSLAIPAGTRSAPKARQPGGGGAKPKSSQPPPRKQPVVSKARRPEPVQRAKSARPASSDPVIKCPLCTVGGKQKHKHAYPRTCPFLTGDNAVPRKTEAEIKKIVNSAAACINCFGPHKTANCDSPAGIVCKIDGCGKRHHRFWH